MAKRNEDVQICSASTKNGNPCRYKGKYTYDGEYYCGIHKPSEAKEIPKVVEKVKATTNLQVQLGKMAIRRKLIHEEGYTYVFPNYRHQNRKDGIGMASLSPMNLGPVKVGKMPKSLCLENWWQGAKLLADEVDKRNKILPAFYETQKEMAESKVGCRRKPNAKKLKTLGWVYTDADNKEHILDYVTSRQFYCNIYAKLVAKEKDFIKLKKMYKKGEKICIAGYDAHAISSYDDLIDRYSDTSKPYGHEIVLCAMLILEPEEYPWVKQCTFSELLA